MPGLRWARTAPVLEVNQKLRRRSGLRNVSPGSLNMNRFPKSLAGRFVNRFA